MAGQNRIVLFPLGPSNDPEARVVCEGLLLHCGADVHRFVDSPSASFEAFVKFVRRLDSAVNGNTPAIIVLTRTNPVALQVINTRRRLCRLFPAFREALWVIFVDVRHEPFFEREAGQLGSLDGPLDGSPIWHELVADDRYLVLTPCTTDIALLQRQLEKLTLSAAQQTRRKSSAMLAAVRGPSSRKS